jgi:60 kDa SS-A/Ro ribonucleoprotein
MAKYANHVANPKTSQSKKAKSSQVKNRAGGFVFPVDSWTRLNRFLIIGNENGGYYASARELTMENYDCILECLKIDPKRTVNTIVDISDNGRAVKNDPAIFALAVCSVHGDEKTRAYANKVMPKVARFSTAFFTWIDAVNTLKEGRKGKGLLRAIGRWYTEKNAVQLAYQVCKYPGRTVGGQRWTHADALRIARISGTKSNGKSGRNGPSLTTPSDEHSTVYRYATHGVTSAKVAEKRLAEAKATGKNQEASGLSDSMFKALQYSDLKYIWAHEQAKVATKIGKVVDLINEFGLTRESVPPQFKNELEVQKALLAKMPMTALIRNLGSMTSSGLLKPLADETSLVIDKITNEEALKKSRIHPMTIMLALKTYSKGAGMRTTWKPVSAIKDAMEDAFYKAFNYVEPTGKKFLYGIDVSGSMAGGCYWASDRANDMSPREAAAIVAMTCARTEKNYEMMAFSHDFVKLNISAKDSLDTVIRRTSNMPFGGTDASLPMQYALKHGLDVDVFVVLTDNETWYGGMHPFEALKAYRKKFNKNAKLAVLAFEANNFTIADPSDAGMMDIAGLDSNVPKVLSEFALGNL